MEKIIWCELGPKKTDRLEILQEFLKSKGVQSEFEFIETDSNNLKEKFEEAKKKFQCIRLHPSLYDRAAEVADRSFKEFKLLKSVDGFIVQEKGEFWPNLLFRDFLVQYLSKKKIVMDVTQEAMIIGLCGRCRAIISSIIQLGFSKISITGASEKEARALIDDFQKIYFSAKIEFVPHENLTLLPSKYGVIVNTFSPFREDEFLREVYYLNSLKNKGLVIDFTEVPTESPLLMIAKNIGASTLSGYEIMAHYDLFWVEHCLKKKMDHKEYVEMVQTQLAKVSYDKDFLDKILEEFHP